MIIAFYGIAFAMIFGGLAALLQGYGIIVMERGWTLVIAGTVASASGALLLGITAGLSRLGAIHAEVARLRERLSRMDSTLPESLRMLDPLDALGPDQGDRGHEQRGPESGQDETSAHHRLDPGRPAFPFKLRDRESPAEGPPVDALGDEALLFGSNAAEPKQDLFGLRGVAARPGAREESESESGPDPARSEAPTVVGTYNSGGNRYTMYSDGSIEANTPNGVYRFSSLDELKSFVASGGESGPRSRAL